MKKRKIFFSYIEPKKFSGQTAATKFIIESMQKSGYDCRSIKLYPLQRSERFLVVSWLKVIFKHFSIIPTLFVLLITRRPVLHLTLGQGTMSFLRVAIWLFPVFLLKQHLKLVTSLNGSTFMTWDREEFQTKFFLAFLKRSRIVTVLGEKQKGKLIKLGISQDQLAIVPNTCNLQPVTSNFVEKKHSNGEIHLLHLSLLIESKGFPEYLEAIEILAKKKTDKKIHAVLCGPISFTSFCTKFKSAEQKEKWIENKVDQINSINSGTVRVQWIRGARGAAKEKLFRKATIFVMPTTFPVEAQPLVLLEALSAGCAVVSSKVGEIESVLNSENAVLIDDTSSENVERKMNELIHNTEKRKKLALNGLKSINGPFSLEAYADTWESLFKGLLNE